MAADNWASCPKCTLTKQKQIAKAEADLSKDYGKVSFETYQKRVEAIEVMRIELTEYCKQKTVREDYGIGLYGEYFEVNFRARCRDCDFAFTYKVDFDVSTMTEISRDIRPSVT